MKVLIVEDEKLSAENLVNLLKNYSGNMEILGILDAIEDTARWFENNPQPDLLFLDIQLADGISFSIFQKVDVKCPVIFTTAYDSFSLKAFQVNSVDYLLKPVSQKSLSRALKKYQELKEYILLNEAQPFSHRELQESITSLKSYKTRFTVKTGNQLRIVPIEEVAYFFSDGHYTRLITNANQSFLINFTLDELEGLLDPQHFFRLNRKFISSLAAIAEIHLYFKGRLKIKLNPPIDQEVIISSEKSPVFKQWVES